MKKLFITAVALVAFSTVSLANTTTDKQTINETVLTVSESQVLLEGTQKVVVSGLCEELAARALDEMDPDCYLGNTTSFHIYRSLVESCESISAWVW